MSLDETAAKSLSRFHNVPGAAPAPPQRHYLDIDLVVLTGLLTAQPAQYIRTTSGLTGDEELTGAELQVLPGGLRRLRLFFDRAITEPMFSSTLIPPVDPT